jgi:hypothetical protein
MNTKSPSTNRNRVKKLKSDTNSEFTSVQITPINKRSKHTIVSPSESSLSSSPIADIQLDRQNVQSNRQLDIVSLKTSQQLASVSVAEAIAKMKIWECNMRLVFQVVRSHPFRTHCNPASCDCFTFAMKQGQRLLPLYNVQRRHLYMGIAVQLCNFPHRE